MNTEYDSNLLQLSSFPLKAMPCWSFHVWNENKANPSTWATGVSLKSIFFLFNPFSRLSDQNSRERWTEGASGSIKQPLNISAVPQSLNMSSRVLFFILLYELSIVPREQIEIFKQIITGFFLKPQYHLHTHTLDSFCFVSIQEEGRRCANTALL